MEISCFASRSSRNGVFFRSQWLSNRFVKSHRVRFASAPDPAKSIVLPLSLPNRISRIEKATLIDNTHGLRGWTQRSSEPEQMFFCWLASLYSRRKYLNQCHEHTFPSSICWNLYSIDTSRSKRCSKKIAEKLPIYHERERKRRYPIRKSICSLRFPHAIFLAPIRGITRLIIFFSHHTRWFSSLWWEISILALLPSWISS